jgi:hypothetical protein
MCIWLLELHFDCVYKKIYIYMHNKYLKNLIHHHQTIFNQKKKRKNSRASKVHIINRHFIFSNYYIHI